MPLRILTRLGMIGWRDEAELILSDFRNRDTFANHRLVNQAKNLTDRSMSILLCRFLS